MPRTLINKVTNSLNSLAIAAATFSGAALMSHTADAMVLHNCSGKSQYIRFRGHSSNKIEYKNLNIRPGQTVTPDLGRGQKYRMLIGAGNSRKTYSGWRATDELSLRTIGGNTEVSYGNYCKKEQPIEDGNNRGGNGSNDGGLCVELGELKICKN